MLTLPGVLAALAAALLIQGQILLDCVDGELARWRRQFSPAGIYLDRFAHFLTETALPIALGIRADGGWDELGGYTALGLLAAVLALLVRMEIVLVHVARAEAGKPPFQDTAAASAPRALAAARGCAARSACSRSSARSSRSRRRCSRSPRRCSTSRSATCEATRALVVALVPVAAVTAVGRLFAILGSERLR